MRAENKRMKAFLKENGITAQPMYQETGSLKGTWRLFSPDAAVLWTPELTAKLTEIGFTNHDGRPLNQYSGNGGRFSVFVRGHDELLGTDAPAFPLPRRIAVTPVKESIQAVYDRIKEPLIGGTVLLLRLGDFYEAFGGDAETIAPILNIVITKRNSVPMCGVPVHAVYNYVPKLVAAGYRVALAEDGEVRETHWDGASGVLEPPYTAEDVARVEREKLGIPEVRHQLPRGWYLEWPGGYVSAMPNEFVARAALDGIANALNPVAET